MIDRFHRRPQPIRPDIAQAMLEKRMLRPRVIACGRCREEVAPGAEWCPHCGFDMSQGGTVERRRRVRRPWHTAWDGAVTKLTRGIVLAFIVLVTSLLIGRYSTTVAIEFGGYSFVGALWVFGAELSVRGLLYMAPTMATTVTFLSFNK